jgi:hypothetical protein
MAGPSNPAEPRPPARWLNVRTVVVDGYLRGTKTPIRHLTSGSLGCGDALLTPL